MLQFGTASSAGSALFRRWREWVCAGSLIMLGAGGIMGPDAARSQGFDRAPRAATEPAAASPLIAKPATASDGSTQPAGAREADARTPRSRDDRRRMLMLLLMNSAGSVGPFGGLGR